MTDTADLEDVTYPNFVVYATPRNVLRGFRLQPEWTGAQVLKKIADAENARTDIDYVLAVQPGMFNYRLVFGALNLQEAFEKAAQTQLIFEPLATVWNRPETHNGSLDIVWARDPQECAVSAQALRASVSGDLREAFNLARPSLQDSIARIRDLSWPMVGLMRTATGSGKSGPDFTGPN